MADTDALVLSISADVRQVMNSLKKLEDGSKDTAAKINKNFANVGNEL